MKTAPVIKKVLLITLWVAAGGGLLSLLLAANGKKKREQCTAYSVSIKGAADNLFVTEKDVLEAIGKIVKGKIKGTALSDFNLSRMESALEKNKWIKDAELWFDSHNALHIGVTERSPVARIFTRSGDSFYIDSSLVIMPLSAHVSLHIPVFTGFPERKKMNRADSVMLEEIKEIATFISEDAFWNAQVAQVDITEQKTFEIIPALGNHLVRIGRADDLEKKFRRLWIFYEQVLSKTGMNKYSVIDVQFRGQVVGLKKGAAQPAVDKERLRQNIDNLLRSSAEIKDKDEIYVNNGKPQEAKPDTVVIPPATIPADPHAVKTIIQPGADGKQAPKAVMKGRNR